MRILSIINMQRGFNPPQTLVNAIADQCRYYDVIVATRFINMPDSAFVHVLHYDRMMTSPDIDIIPALLPYADIIADKHGYSAASLLPDGDVDLCGMDTDACIMATALDLFNKPNTAALILPTLCASSGGIAIHHAALDMLQRNVGMVS